jgi:hypothetical protein
MAGSIMATTTPNYGWDVPTSTDYVKDGASAIEILGDDIDATLYSVTGGKNVGLVAINSTTITTAGTVTVDNVFTSAFDNYVIVLNVKNNANNDTGITFQFRNAGATIGGTAYSKNNIQSYGSTVAATGTNGTSNWNFGSVSQTSYSQTVATIGNPAVAKSKALQFQNAHAQTAFSALDTNTGYGVNTTATAYDGMILTVSGGTLTGTLKIYGYRN